MTSVFTINAKRHGDCNEENIDRSWPSGRLIESPLPSGFSHRKKIVRPLRLCLEGMGELGASSEHFDPAPTSKLARLDLVEMVSLAADYRRSAEGNHPYRVGQLAAMIADKLGIPEREIRLIQQAAPLHDIGEIFVPERILYKPAKLEPQEFEVVKTHVSHGVNMLPSDRSELVKTARLIVETHHERWDGSGYPYGLKGLRIPLIGQVVAVADVFDALCHDQPYRPALSTSEAVHSIEADAGKKFDPQVVEAFLKVASEKYWHEEVVATGPRAEVIMKGSLGNISLFDLLTLFLQSMTTATVHLYPGFHHARVHLLQGHIVHAEIDTEVGERALLRIAQKIELSAKTRFLVESVAQAQAQSVSIHKDSKALLIDVAVKLDEERHSLKSRI